MERNTEIAGSTHFFLRSECLLVTGAVNAAIYDLSSGNVYSIDGAGRKVLELSEQGVSIPSIHPLLTKSARTNEIFDYLHKLERLGLGNFSPNPVPPSKVEIKPAPYGLRKIWLELTSRCNLRCVHCYADSSTKKYNRNLSLKQWQMIIKEAASLGARWIQLIGGEPLLYGKRNIFELLREARKARYDFIEVFTNGTLLDDQYVGFFAEYGIHVALSVYSKRPEIHDMITRRPGSFQRTMKNAEKLRQGGVPVRFGMVVMKQNYQYEAETLEWIQTEYGYSPVSCDIVRCSLGDNAQQMALLTPELWKRKLRAEPSFPKVNLEDFTRNKLGHPCISGEVCVHADGTVYPCVMDRMNLLGNIRKASLRETIKGTQTQVIWGLSKDHIVVCHDCEYRYACFDCRPLAVAVAEAIQPPARGLFTKDPCCLYDPYKGEWGNTEQFLHLVHEVTTGQALTESQRITK